THPQRSLLMRALGSGDHVEPDLSIREVRAGDRYLICSDGLSGVVSHQTMEEALASYQGPQETIQDLIQLALRGGGPDNITCIVADVLDVDSNDTLAVQLNDTPVIVGAVAENQAAQLNDGGAMQTPAGRAAGLGRPVPPPAGGFGPPGSGEGMGYGSGPGGAFNSYTDDDFVKPRGGRKWLKRSVYTILALAVIGGGVYGGYRWTQTQFYVGAQGENVALYRGISQDLAWVSLSKVEENTEIELKYLPPYQRKQVEATIAEGNLADARKKVGELETQASACKKDAQRRAAVAGSKALTGEGEAGGTTGAPAKTSAKSSTQDTTSSTQETKPTATPTPGPSLSEEEKKLVPQCGKQ
ncbi:MAG TPA: protein phosphatase, partial [Streptomyces sp.]